MTWSPEEGEDVKYNHVRWSWMSYEELDVFHHGFSASLKEVRHRLNALKTTVMH